MRAYRKLLLIAMLGLSAGAQARGDVPGRFDYYAVALSWSPSYCATNRDPDQCDAGRKLGFVLHGLWPQFEAGYPEECSREQLPGAVRGRYAAIYPSEKLIGHEWKKHGTCSGLDQAFRSVNPGMARDSVLPFCSGGGRFLREIHACFDKGGQSRSCSSGEIKRSYSSCRQPSFLLESVR
jgi:ribonuclease T2